MRNLAGNDVSIFLFQFELRGAGIDFVLNEGIAADMYQDLDEQLKPLIHAYCATLLRYRHLSISNVIMDGNFLVSGEFEVMLSKGLGRHLIPHEKAQLFQDAKQIADLLDMVMNRRTQEEKAGRPTTSSRHRSLNPFAAGSPLGTSPSRLNVGHSPCRLTYLCVKEPVMKLCD